MSRIGKLPVPLDKGVKATIDGRLVRLEGPKGKLEMEVPAGFNVEVEDSVLTVKRPTDSSRERSLHGLTRKLLANMAEGVGKGFVRTLEINGVGYRAEVRGGNTIYLTLGYSHPILYQLPVGVSAKIERQVLVTLEGADRQLLGMVAAQLRELRPPEPYKGKGIKYAEEKIRRKAGKAAAGSSGG
ncbi:MAG TPA: 50S ribosomal protein L6 [Candidatus Binataceae bacterium]|jgi:large subunit ribosomal protein L6|nr:50S ribosomal protein L6 [Candidatus Binataceae bacterium]HZY58234.1 50S ribosomal protein L6 [Candidatus Binataceae bacterium]